ncbi:hypothetical protein DIPPA_25559 [Diplonema papillatum]|nr:hypothetical protein DIPPA_25559 [Diplonema papillatum]|eukprot:gene6540-9992_t
MNDQRRVLAWGAEGVEPACTSVPPPPADDPHELLQARNRDLRRLLAAAGDEKASLSRQVEDLARELAIKTARIDDLERVLRGGVPAAPPPSLPDPPHASPAVTLGTRFCNELTGTTVSLTKTVAEATHAYNKLAITEPERPAGGDAYAEFVLEALPSRYSSIGVVLCSGLPQVNLNTDSIGEHSFSYGWCSDKYWTASLVNNGESRGPPGGDWQLGSVIGVFVSGGSISFYLDGVLKHKHAFTGLKGSFRFAVGFGGPKTVHDSYGRVALRCSAPGDDCAE